MYYNVNSRVIKINAHASAFKNDRSANFDGI